MDSLNETQRQIRIAILLLATIIPIGVIGFMILEGYSLLDSVWLTVITLATIGYGDLYARTDAGRVFTLILILFGIGAVAYGLQATATFLVSPAIREVRQRRRIQRAVSHLHDHYIICGSGELVDDTIHYLTEAAWHRQHLQINLLAAPVDQYVGWLFGTPEKRSQSPLWHLIRSLLIAPIRFLHRSETLLDRVVVVTPDHGFADHIAGTGLLVVEGDPTNEEVLKRAGIDHAHALMVILDNDTEALLTVLTARNLNAEFQITATLLDESLAAKMVRVGANAVIAHYDAAASFLNNVTLRPAVNSFFTSILFSQQSNLGITQLYLWDDSPWIGQSIGTLQLRELFNAGIIGIRRDDATYDYAPADDRILNEGEILIAVAPAARINALQSACRKNTSSQPRIPNWQRLAVATPPPLAPHPARTLQESAAVAAKMSQHYIICAAGKIARSAITRLNPARPFIIISNDPEYVEHLLQRGFVVIQGDPTQESVLKTAGVQRALAVMVTAEDKARSVLTVLNCRAMSKHLLITAAAPSEDAVPKLARAGADRVIAPYQVAAQFVLLATTRPVISDFLQYVLFNYAAGIETAELYMEHDSPWIGQTIQELGLEEQYSAGVIGLRLASGQYLYAPPGDHTLQEDEVLIVVTPMEHSDLLRELAHGSVNKRPATLRRDLQPSRLPRH
jgi:voltage-gated potassium channel